MEFEHLDIFVRTCISSTLERWMCKQLSKCFLKRGDQKGWKTNRGQLQVKGIKVGTLEGGSAPQVWMRHVDKMCSC